MARRKKKQQDENDEKPRSPTDFFRRTARKPTTIDEALYPRGPYDRPGFMTGWSLDGPYEIRLPSTAYRCPVEGQEFATAELLELHRRANHPGPLERLAQRLTRLVAGRVPGHQKAEIVRPRLPKRRG